MSFTSMGELNWLAVIVATVVYYAIGALWYSPKVFGKPWMKSIGWNPDPERAPTPPSYYILPFFGYVVYVIAIGMLAAATGTDTFAEGLVLGFVLGVLLSGATYFTIAKFEPGKPDPMAWFIISGGYTAVGTIISSIILAVWR